MLMSQQQAFKLRSWTTIFVFQLLALFVYEAQLVETNPVSVKSMDFGLAYFYRITIGFALLWFLLPKGFAKPSDFFLFLYGLFVVGNYVFFGFYNRDYLDSYHVGLIIIILPIFVLKYVLQFKIKIKNIGLFSTNAALLFLSFFSIVIVLYSIKNAPTSAGFSFDASYVRRLEGREVYAAGTVIAYLINMLANGIGPYLAFVAGEKNLKILIPLSIFIATIWYFLLGLKAPIVLTFLAFCLGLLVRSGSLGKLPKISLFLVIGLIVIVIFEWVLNNGFSLVAELSFRRMNVVPGQVVSHYLEFITSNNLWSLWSGLDHMKGVTYLIGELYYTEDSNVNTSAFLVSLANNGIFGCLFIVFVVMVFFGAIDNIYRLTKNPGFIYIGFFYSIIILEQAATTALLSSGFALIFLVLFFEKRRMVCSKRQL